MCDQLFNTRLTQVLLIMDPKAHDKMTTPIKHFPFSSSDNKNNTQLNRY